MKETRNQQYKEIIEAGANQWIDQHGIGSAKTKAFRAIVASHFPNEVAADEVTAISHSCIQVEVWVDEHNLDRKATIELANQIAATFPEFSRAPKCGKDGIGLSKK